MTGRLVLRDRQQWSPNTMVSTGHQAATFAALDVMSEGGNVFDAVITASAVMTVALPMSCGLAGDASALLYEGASGRTISFTSLGRAPATANPATFRRLGLSDIPVRGALSWVTPAMADAWFALQQRCGSRPLSRLLQPAIDLARHGLVVSSQFSRWTAENIGFLQQPQLIDLYSPAIEGTGTIIRQSALANCYERLATMSRDDFYATLGEEVAAVSGQYGGLLTADDSMAPHEQFENPAKAVIGNRTVMVTGAPTQGPLLLQNLLLFERSTTQEGISPTSALGIHLLGEIVNQTFGWRVANWHAPEVGPGPDPLNETVLEALLSRIDTNRRSASACTRSYSEGDTTHMVLVDDEGNAVSWVQSLGLGFGSGLGLPDLGILLSNRLGRSATLNVDDPNGPRPSARPVNTIFPWFVADGSGLRHLGGTPGGDGQCQWNTQVIASLLFDGASVLEALSQPRWTYFPGGDKTEHSRAEQLHVTSDLSPASIEELRRRGHDVVVKAGLGGIMRVLEILPEGRYGLDDGCQEGLTAGR